MTFFIFRNKKLILNPVYQPDCSSDQRGWLPLETLHANVSLQLLYRKVIWLLTQMISSLVVNAPLNNHHCGLQSDATQAQMFTDDIMFHSSLVTVANFLILEIAADDQIKCTVGWNLY